MKKGDIVDLEYLGGNPAEHAPEYIIAQSTDKRSITVFKELPKNGDEPNQWVCVCILDRGNKAHEPGYKALELLNEFMEKGHTILSQPVQFSRSTFRETKSEPNLMALARRK